MSRMTLAASVFFTGLYPDLEPTAFGSSLTFTCLRDARNVPNQCCCVRAPRNQSPAVGRKCQRVHPPSVALKHANLTTRGDAPENDAVVQAGCGEELAVRRERHGRMEIPSTPH